MNYQVIDVKVLLKLRRFNQTLCVFKVTSAILLYR